MAAYAVIKQRKNQSGKRLIRWRPNIGEAKRMTEHHFSRGTSKTFLLSSCYYRRFLCYVKVSFKHKDILCISSLNKLLIKGETENATL